MKKGIAKKVNDKVKIKVITKTKLAATEITIPTPSNIINQAVLLL